MTEKNKSEATYRVSIPAETIKMMRSLLEAEGAHSLTLNYRDGGEVQAFPGHDGTTVVSHHD